MKPYVNGERLSCIGGPLDGQTRPVQTLAFIPGNPANSSFTSPDGSRYYRDDEQRAWVFKLKEDKQ